MVYGITYLEWLFIVFFIVVATLLIINILTINKLKDEKSNLSDNEKLLTNLLGEIQNYFSKIDNNISSVASEEHQLRNQLDAHQKDEDIILNALELNQTLFLDRMDKIVNIQQALSKQLQTNVTSNISPDMIRMADTFMSVQKRDMSHVKNRLDSILAVTASLNQSIQDSNTKNSLLDTEVLSGLIEERFSLHFDALNQSIEAFKEELHHKSHDIKESDKDIDEAIMNIEALNHHIDIAKRNIQNVIEQSIDLNPIYKSIHELIEQIKTIFTDYHLAKGEIQKLLQSLQAHEHKDLLELKKEVEFFLKEIKEDIKSSVELLQKEYHLGQTQVSGTVKTLSDRSQASSAYQENLE